MTTYLRLLALHFSSGRGKKLDVSLHSTYEDFLNHFGYKVLLCKLFRVISPSGQLPVNLR